jgi:hypothetical protein
MTPYIPEELSARLIDRSPFVIIGNTMPPRDPDEDEDDEEEEEDGPDEPPVVREPDETTRSHARVTQVSRCAPAYFRRGANDCGWCLYQ